MRDEGDRKARLSGVGHHGRTDEDLALLTALGEPVDLTGEILRRPIVLSGCGRWKPRPGRVYDFPVRRGVEEK